MDMSKTTPHGPLLLGGFMGTGKSTVGPLVASCAGVPFIDLDATIEAATGTSITSLFETAGEAAFRQVESATLQQLLASPEPRVIALGGGTLVDPHLRNFALHHARVINLVARPDTIAHRVHATGRPLLDSATHPLHRIRELLTAREHAYADAHGLIRTDQRDPTDIARAILQAWQDEALLVRTTSASYAARITHDAPTSLAELVRSLAPSSTFLVTDHNVDPIAAPPIINALRAADMPVVGKVVLTPGETHKQWPAVHHILQHLVTAGADRNSLVIALGGGVVSDITGFAAAILFRGVLWIATPTTMLSMVDAAVGGKTAVDLGPAKNAVGAFHQPAGVIIHPAYVVTESTRAYTSGLAEVIKSGAIADPSLIELIERERQSVLDRNPTILQELIRRSLRIKADIVSRDERESGERMLLNFGHTIGHGLEAAGNYNRLTHGEAVALGIVAVLRFGQARGITAPNVAKRVEDLLEAIGLPTNLSEQPLDEAMKLVAFDKKRTATNVRMVLLEDAGRARIESVPLDELRGFCGG